MGHEEGNGESNESGPLGPTDSDTLHELARAKPASDGAVTRLEKVQARRAILGDQEPAAKIGRFTVIERLGAGGLGVVYAAYDPRLDRRIALKLVSATTEEEQRHVLREARSLAKLTHPNVVHVYDAEALEDVVYIAMEYIDGGTLRWWLEDEERSPEEIASMFCQAGRGLVAAHKAGLVHGDFKPENVLIGSNGRARVADFGLARPTSEARDEGETVTLARGGTPAYMAPEQWRGDAPSSASDQFSFGVALAEALEGERPYAGDSADEIRDAVLAGAPRLPAKANKNVRKLLERSLEPDADRRFPTMGELIEVLERSYASPWPRRLVVLGVLGAALAGGALWQAGSDSAAECERVGEGARQDWGPELRETIRKRLGDLEAGEPGFSERLFEITDAYVARLADQREQACRATRVDRVQSETLLDLRMRCLERRQSVLRGFLGELTGESQLSSSSLMDAANDLPSLLPCEDGEALLGHLALPEDSTTRDRIASLEARVAVARGRFKSHSHLAGTLLVARLMVIESLALGWPALEARARLHLGSILRGRFETVEARSQLGDALIAARRARDPLLVVEAYTHLASTIAQAQEYSAMEVLTPAAEAELGQVSPVGRQQAFLLRVLASTSLRLGNLEQAQTYARRALSAWPTSEVPPSTLLRSTIGQIEAELGQRDEAAASFDEALSRAVQEYGTGNPITLLIRARLVDYPWYAKSRPGLDAESIVKKLEALSSRDAVVAEVYLRLADSVLQRGNASGSLELAGTALEISSRLAEADHLTLRIQEQRGRALLALGRFQEAADLFDGTIARRREMFGRSSATLLLALKGRGTAARELRDGMTAMRSFDAARTIVEVYHGGNSELYLNVLNDQAILFAALGLHDEAISTLRSVVAILRSSGAGGGERVARPLTNIGYSLFEIGKLAEARRAFEQAIEEIEGAQGTDGVGLNFPLTGLARVGIAEKRFAEAVRDAERALTVLVDGGADGRDVLIARTVLAEAYLAADRRSKAQEQARIVVEGVKPLQGESKVEILQWLRARGLP